MYPYVRQEIQLITTQPGVIPILLPLNYPKVEIKDNNTIVA